MRPWLTSGRLLPGLTLQVLSLRTSPGLVQQVSCVQRQNKTMNAKIADNAGILKLKMLVMVNTKMFKHPKYYKELRKRNKLDQVISRGDATAAGRRAPGPGLKPQAASDKLQAPGVKLSNQPVQASSGKRQAPSSKRQA